MTQEVMQGGLVQVVAIAGGKGGTGKTQTALNLAVQLQARGQKVLLLDGSMALPGLDIACGLQPVQTLQDAMAGTCPLGGIVQAGPLGVQMLVSDSLRATGEPPSVLQMAGLIQAFSTLPELPDVLLVDCGNLQDDAQMLLLRAASEILLVSSDEPAADAGTLTLIRRLQGRFGLNRFRLLATMTASEQGGVALHERLLRLTESLPGVSLDHVGSVPFDETLRRAVQRQKVVSEMFPRSRSALAYRDLADKLTSWPLPANPRGHLEFFAERLIARTGRMAITER